MKTKSLAKSLLITAIFLGALIVWVQFSSYSSLKDVKDGSHSVFDVPEFKYLISKPECSRDSSTPYFVTLVLSKPSRFERRIASRDTWAHSDPRTKTYFLMGMVESPILKKRIIVEEAKFKDIIQGNFVDSYRNKTYKHTMALKWFSENCPHVKYLLKLDDDVFPNIPAIHQYLVSSAQYGAYIHGIKGNRTVVREGKRKIKPEEFNHDQFPEYVDGSAAIYPSTFVREALKKTLTTPFFWMDDVYISGIIRKKLNAKIISISHLKLTTNTLYKIGNGTLTTLPRPMFLVTQHKRKYEDALKLWEMTESYRHAHNIYLKT
ncbi:beta-1,3-galactosyltransferase 2-like [Sitodiplosis mosellana]|uniref:beta-1,3-galactosyltransferase 2-like n=1 Tax=Sitodiplosis mosellana TaxID=263140 RepID=UPI002443EA6C|nr:beta-1,3-galactosyltransferase 2-like [Sitodiplosis mosellana]